MLSDRQSKLKRYGLGVVTKDKDRKSDEIEVSIMEEFPFTDGLIVNRKESYTTELPDKQGVMRKSKADKNVIIKAIWLGEDTNRITSPDVIKNETVVIWRYADTQEYYWTKEGREPEIRRQETVCYAFGNLKEPLKRWDKKSSYFEEWSTHDKYIVQQTSQSDGEKFGYTNVTHAGKGKIFRGDNVGNYFRIDSGMKLVEHRNVSNTYHSLYGDAYFIGASRGFTVVSAKAIIDCAATYVRDLIVNGTLHVNSIEAGTIKANVVMSVLKPGSGNPKLTMPSLGSPPKAANPKDEFHDTTPPK